MTGDSSGPPRSKSQTLKDALHQRGLKPRKMLGQNFMLDTNFAAAIARDAALDEQTLAIEVGPGTGCLTQALLDSHPAARVLAIELDSGLAELLRDTFAEPIRGQRLTLIEDDALSGKHSLSPQLVETALRISKSENRPRRVLAANLPYNAATPILANMAADAEGLGMSAAIATVQLELAERFFAKPGESTYGALSAFIALRATGKIVRRVGNAVFWPRPDVDSAVIRLDFKPWPEKIADSESSAPMHPGEAKPFRDFLQTLFSQRRKMLRAVLKPRVIPAALGLSPEARAEDLAPEMLLALFRILNAGSSNIPVRGI